MSLARVMSRAHEISKITSTFANRAYTEVQTEGDEPSVDTACETIGALVGMAEKRVAVVQVKDSLDGVDDLDDTD